MASAKQKLHTTTGDNGIIFTSKMREYIRKGVQLGQYFHMHPYIWSFETKKDKQGTIRHVTDSWIMTKSKYASKSKWRLHLWHFNVLLTFAYSIFVGVRCYQTIQDATKTTAQKVYMQFVTVYFSASSGLQMAAYFYGPALPSFVRGYMQFFDAFEKEFLDDLSCGERSHKLRMIRIGEALMINMYRSINCVVAMMMIGCYLRPDSPELLSSLTSDPKSLNFVQKIPFVLFLGYIVVIYATHCYILLQMGTGFFFPTLVLLKKLNEGITSSKGTATFQKYQRLFLLYDAVVLLVRSYNEVFCTLAIPVAKLSLITFIIICTYCGIRMTGFDSLSLGFIGCYSFLVLTVFFALLSEFHTRSSKVINSLRRTGFSLGSCPREVDAQQKLYLKRVVRSLRPVKIRLRSFYYVDKDMVLTMVDGIVQETVNFLLAN